MRHTLKAVLLIMLLLTLPLRGFAAMTAYGETRHHDGMAVSHHAISGAAAMHDHSQHQQHDQHNHGKNDSCSVCGACCTGAMSISFFSTVTANVAPASQVIAFYDRPYAGFIPEGLDRPPTSLS